MAYRSLIIKKNLEETVVFQNNSLPFSFCTDNFNDYFVREWGCHWHGEYEFGIIRRGSVLLSVFTGRQQADVTLSAGEGLFINSGFLHNLKALEPDTVITEFVISPAFFDTTIFSAIPARNALRSVDSSISHVIFRKEQAEDSPIFSSIIEACSIEEDETWYDLHIIEIVCKIWRNLHTYLQGTTTVPVDGNPFLEARLKSLLSFIHTHYQRKITVEEIARAAGISRTECFRCFKTVLKKTPTEYLNEYRLTQASLLLTQTQRSLGDIAFSCGFQDLSYFCKLFKQRYGISPKQYRLHGDVV